MKGDKLLENYYMSINELAQDILLLARTEKKIDDQLFDKFYSILIELERELKDQEFIPRKIAGLLFFIFRSLSEEAEYCNYNDDLFISVGKLEEILDRIFWESPFKK